MTPPQEQDPRLERLDPFPGRVVAGNFRIDKLIGAGATLNVGGGVLVVPGNAANTATLSDTLTLADNVTVAGIDMSTGASSAIGGTNVTGINVSARNARWLSCSV